MRELTAIALAANLALVNAFQVLPSSCVHRSKLLAWSLASSSQLPTTIRSARGSHDDVEPERVRTPMEPTTVVVERGVALDVGSTFFRAESYLSRDLSVLAAYLYKVFPLNCINTHKLLQIFEVATVERLINKY
jgi:hypothetical protein